MSERITLKDNLNRIIGYIEIRNNGDKVLKDQDNRIKGYYVAEFNTTKDANNRIVGYGDILTSLL